MPQLQSKTYEYNKPKLDARGITNLSSRKDIERTQKFCKALPAQLKDENMAVAEYNAKAAEARKLNYPGAELIAILYEKLAMDEASHGDVLRKMQKEVCPI